MKKEVNWNKNFHHEYLEDKTRIEVAIKLGVIYKSLVENFFIKYHYFNQVLFVTWTQNSALAQILIEDLKIPYKLFQDLKNKKREAIYYINAIIDKILPLINKELLFQKYKTGNILIFCVSFLDIQKITLIYHETKVGWQNIIIPWVFFPKHFPPLQNFSWQNNPPTYIRDYIDAMEMYLKYNFDECIRKIITSLETCFLYYKLKISKNDPMIQLIEKYITQPIIKENIIFIYNLRNKIVHEGFSLKSDQKWICKKAIGTMSYVLQHPFIKKEEIKYICLLVMQFLLIDQEMKGIDLEEMQLFYTEFNSLSEKEKEMLCIKTSKDLDDFVFSNLEITKAEKEKILTT